MPELPDLELFKDNLKSVLLNLPLNNISSGGGLDEEALAELKATLLFKKLDDIKREGKELFFCFGSDRMFMHLMLYGKFVITEKPIKAMLTLEFGLLSNDITKERFNKICKVARLSYDNTECLYDKKLYLNLVDPFRYAKISLNKQKNNLVDALSEELTKEKFILLCDGISKNVKSFLIDQKTILGIGNAYADEILYDAKISPKSKLNKIPGEEKIKLYYSIGKVLKEAYCFLKELTPYAIGGEERSFLKVHIQSKETALGEKIVIENIGGKKTYFVKEQVEYV